MPTGRCFPRNTLLRAGTASTLLTQAGRLRLREINMLRKGTQGRIRERRRYALEHQSLVDEEMGRRKNLTVSNRFVATTTTL
jgi:hypothetical protein